MQILTYSQTTCIKHFSNWACNVFLGDIIIDTLFVGHVHETITI